MGLLYLLQSADHTTGSNPESWIVPTERYMKTFLGVPQHRDEIYGMARGLPSSLHNQNYTTGLGMNN